MPLFYVEYHDEHVVPEARVAQKEYLERAIDSIAELVVIFLSESHAEVTPVLVSTSMRRALHEAVVKVTECPTHPTGSESSDFISTWSESSRPRCDFIDALLRDILRCAIQCFGLFPGADRNELVMSNAITYVSQICATHFEKRVELWIASPGEFERMRSKAIAYWRSF